MVIIKEKITIEDIRESLYEANLDTEYREALADSLMKLKYISASPLELYYGTERQKKELKKLETTALNSNQISEIIHLMMYEMRNDFQYGEFKPVAMKYIEISERMKKENLKNEIKTSKIKKSQKIKCNMYDACVSIPERLGKAAEALKQNNMNDESREMIERATLSYSYDDVLEIINEYVEVIEKYKEEEEEFE